MNRSVLYRSSVSRALGLLLGLALCLGGASVARAELTVNRQFSDHMVLQRDQVLTLRGAAEAGAEVSVAFAGQNPKAKAGEDGRWEVKLEPIAASDQGQSLTVSSGGKTLTLKDIVVGDVILVARQTTIDISLGRDDAGRKAAQSIKVNPRLRVMSIQTIPAIQPQPDLAAEATSGWAVLDATSALKMSAAAYYMARDLAGESDVPLGIIDLNMGPAFAISWMDRETLMETEKFYGRTDVPGMVSRFDNITASLAEGKPVPHKEIVTTDPQRYPIYPAAGYNAVLHPLRNLALKASLVQLGNDYPYMIYDELKKTGKHLDREELNRAYVQTYDIRKNGFRMEPVTTPRIPREWRKVFGNAQLPMGLIVPPGSSLNTLGQHHREMRELQRLIAQDNEAVGVILPGSANVTFSAQPADDELLGSRCASWVKGAVYGKSDTPATGPMFDRIQTNFNTATVHFKPGTAAGLRDAGEGLGQFEVAGLDSVYSPASAKIDGEVIQLSSDTVNRIVHVRYDWQHVPVQGLVNGAGLPAMPFRSEKAPYHWFVTNEESDLPEEYYTPANQWKSGDVTLVNGQLKTHGYKNMTGWLGPIGVNVGPFGPNMGVRRVIAGSPAEGKLFEGDIIYAANGKMLAEDPQQVMSAAITHSETREGAGKLVLSVRRDGKNIDVPLTLTVMGSFSSTSPYDCPKTEKIIADLQQWCADRGGDEGFLGSNALFLLGTGDPQYQGLVRRAIYAKIAGWDPSKPIDPKQGPKAWYPAWDALLLGEYYFATGDRNVLPHLKYCIDQLAAKQNPEGGWRHNYPGGDAYGLLPAIGVPAMIGFSFAHSAGLDIDMNAYARGLRFYHEDAADVGFIIYGFPKSRRFAPPAFDPAVMAKGMLHTSNGALSAAALLFKFEGETRTAHLCSLISAFAWNTTYEGHGGSFWNNFWTPLGAAAHGREAFIHFWKGHRWYREFNRMFDGSLIIADGDGVGAGPGLALVVPRQRLQITGAPKSPFAAKAPDFLKPAVEAYFQKDYARCEQMVNDILASGTVGRLDLPTVEYLGRAAREIQQSIDLDLAKMQSLINAGKPYEASLDLKQLKMIMPAADKRLESIEKALTSPDAAAAVAADRKRYDALQKSLAPVTSQIEKDPVQRKWECLVTEIATERSGPKGPELGKVPAEQASVWRLMVVEDRSQAPKDWVKPGFDDSSWDQTHLPISWRMYHTALLRTTFEVKDKNAFDGMRFRGWLFRQQDIEVYLNGELVAKVNNLEEKTGNVEAEFKDSIVKKLRNGTNTLAVTTRHNWRWGMLSMHVYNDGFGFRLDARVKE